MSAQLVRRLAASLQGRQPFSLAIRLDEQVRHRHRQRPGHRLERRDRHVLRTAPDPSDIGTVDAGRERRPLLRQALRDPQPPQIPVTA